MRLFPLNGRTPWLVNRSDPNWDDPPSTSGRGRLIRQWYGVGLWFACSMLGKKFQRHIKHQMVVGYRNRIFRNGLGSYDPYDHG